MPAPRAAHLFASLWQWRKNIKKLIQNLALSSLNRSTPRTVAAALRGVIRLLEDFDEREFKAKRLSSRFGVLGLTQKGGAHVCLDGQ